MLPRFSPSTKESSQLIYEMKSLAFGFVQRRRKQVLKKREVL
jgi:hypothetical protein